MDKVLFLPGGNTALRSCLIPQPHPQAPVAKETKAGEPLARGRSVPAFHEPHEMRHPADLLNLPLSGVAEGVYCAGGSKSGEANADQLKHVLLHWVGPPQVLERWRAFLRRTSTKRCHFLQLSPQRLCLALLAHVCRRRKELLRPSRRARSSAGSSLRSAESWTISERTWHSLQPVLL